LQPPLIVGFSHRPPARLAADFGRVGFLTRLAIGFLPLGAWGGAGPQSAQLRPDRGEVSVDVVFGVEQVRRSPS
jgi:hypothetical protein